MAKKARRRGRPKSSRSRSDRWSWDVVRDLAGVGDADCGVAKLHAAIASQEGLVGPIKPISELGGRIPAHLS